MCASARRLSRVQPLFMGALTRLAALKHTQSKLGHCTFPLGRPWWAWCIHSHVHSSMCASARLQDTVQPSLMVAQTRLVPQISKQLTWAGPTSAAAPLHGLPAKVPGLGSGKDVGRRQYMPPALQSRLQPPKSQPASPMLSLSLPPAPATPPQPTPMPQAMAMRLRGASSAIAESQHAERDDSEQALVAAHVHIQSKNWSNFCTCEPSRL